LRHRGELITDGRKLTGRGRDEGVEGHVDALPDLTAHPPSISHGGLRE
jgi:hypothetical protein